MKALVFNGPGKIIYESFDDPIISAPKNLIIKVTKCSICGSDLHPYHGDKIGKTDYSQPVERFCTGHEMIGEVVEIGKGVLQHKVGDKILVSGGRGCGECRPCQMGQVNHCLGYIKGNSATVYGISNQLNGGHAEYFEVHNADLGSIRIPDGINEEQAILLTDALSTGYYGVKMSRVKPGGTVAIFGQGPVGYMAAESAFAAGASKVFTIEPVKFRRDKSAKLGTIALHPDEAVRTIMETTKGVGVDSVIDAAGKAATVKLAAKIVRLGGSISVLGILQPGIPVPLNYLQLKSVNLHAGITGIVDLWPELLPLVQSGKIKGEGVFTHQFKLSEGAEAFKVFNANEDDILKVMITPD